VLAAIVNDLGANAELKSSAAIQLRSRGNPLDATTEARVTQIVGPELGDAATAGSAT